MRRTILLTSALLAFTLPPAAWSADRQDDRYGRYPGRTDMRRVAELASQLEHTTTYVHREFERNNRRPDRNEERVAIRLHELERQADRFRGQVDGYGRDPRSTERDFQRLLDAFYAAEESLRYTGRRSYVERGLDQIGGILSELTRYYGRYDDYSRRGGRYRGGRNGRYDGRYDRDRDDDHDRDGYRRPPQP